MQDDNSNHHLHLVTPDERAQTPPLDEVAVAIADVCSMPLDDALVVLERARQSIPRELAATRSIFATLAAFEAAPR